jgi:hypothetical protein
VGVAGVRLARSDRCDAGVGRDDAGVHADHVAGDVDAITLDQIDAGLRRIDPHSYTGGIPGENLTAGATRGHALVHIEVVLGDDLDRSRVARAIVAEATIEVAIDHVPREFTGLEGRGSACGTTRRAMLENESRRGSHLEKSSIDDGW